MNIPRGDFIGFTIDGIHSSRLGIIRVSESSRFTENLLPAFSDKTVQIPGGDGVYYFGREYSTRSFSISIAYDNLKEKQIRQIRRLFYTKTTHSLIFDEYPYKMYNVVVQSPPQLKFLCFDDENGERVYKGEGTISFVSHVPYAITKNKYLEDYTGTIDDSLPQAVQGWYKTESNLDEWIASSGILPRTNTITTGNSNLEIELDKYDRVTGNLCICVYNPGDVETPFQLAVPLTSIPLKIEMSLTVNNEIKKMQVVVNKDDVVTGDKGIVIDTEIGAILGHTSSDPSVMLESPQRANLYNKCITKGDFFNIPVTPEITIMRFPYSPYTTDAIKIQYNYRYL